MVQINCLRADYLSNKLPADLRGWVAVAESSHSPIHKKTSSAAQQQGCKFLEVSLTLKRQLVCQGGRVFCQVRILICQVGTFICQEEKILSKNGDLFSHVYGA